MVRLDSSIFSFLKDLKSNNNRNWFNENKTTFKDIEYKIKSFASNLFDELNKHDNIET